MLICVIAGCRSASFRMIRRGCLCPIAAELVLIVVSLWLATGTELCSFGGESLWPFLLYAKIMFCTFLSIITAYCTYLLAYQFCLYTICNFNTVLFSMMNLPIFYYLRFHSVFVYCLNLISIGSSSISRCLSYCPAFNFYYSIYYYTIVHFYQIDH